MQAYVKIRVRKMTLERFSMEVSRALHIAEGEQVVKEEELEE